MEAFGAFDFDGDERWRQHLSNVELPGLEGSEQQSRALRLLRAKWYKKSIDPSFDVDAVRHQAAGTPAASAARSSTPSASSSSAKAQQHQEETTSREQQHPEAPPRTPSRSSNAMSSNTQTLLFGLHVAEILLSVLSMVPMVPFARRAFPWALQAASAAHATKLHAAHGAPTLRPFPGAITSWMSRVKGSTDLHYLGMAVVFMSGRPVYGVLPPLLVLAAYHASQFANVRFQGHPLWAQYGSRAHRWLSDNQQQALLLCAVSEVSLGFLCVLSLLSPARSITQTLLMWNVLKIRYKSTESSWYHQQVWRLLNEKAQPYYSRVSAVEFAVTKAREWFVR